VDDFTHDVNCHSYISLWWSVETATCGTIGLVYGWPRAWLYANNQPRGGPRTRSSYRWQQELNPATIGYIVLSVISTWVTKILCQFIRPTFLHGGRACLCHVHSNIWKRRTTRARCVNTTSIYVVRTLWYAQRFASKCLLGIAKGNSRTTASIVIS
jgi:hypothetical protein